LIGTRCVPAFVSVGAMGTFGLVLTATDALDRQLYPFVRAQRFTMLKVVTGWGIGRPWTFADRARVLAMTPRTIVRTIAGDPSYRAGAFLYPEPKHVIAETWPWCEIQPHIAIEIGNEPNVTPGWNDDMAWAYRYWLEQLLPQMRHVYPDAYLIAPGPSFMHPGAARYLEICADVMRGFDAVAVHVYGFHSLNEPGVRDVRWAYDRLFDARMPRWITELGIREPARDVNRLALYRDFTNQLAPPWLGACVYHYGADRQINPEYHVG